jgi:hypothetical protein
MQSTISTDDGGHSADREGIRGGGISRRQFCGGVGKTVAAAAGMSAVAGMLTASEAASAPGSDRPADKKKTMTPETKLVDDYNTWFIGGAYEGDMDKLRAGLPSFITNETVLQEAASLPWGGKSVGYEGWVRVCSISGPIFEKLGSLVDLSAPTYYQDGHTVLHQLVMTIKPTGAAPEPFVMGVMEKYTVAHGRISYIDEFYADTAGFLERLTVLGAIPRRDK